MSYSETEEPYLARLIRKTSLADESKVSVTGAGKLAKAVINSDFTTRVRKEARLSLIKELIDEADQEVRIGRLGDDDERVRVAEKLIEMLNDTPVE